MSMPLRPAVPGGDDDWDESKVSRHPAGSGHISGRFREKVGALGTSALAMGYAAGGALIAGEIAEKAEKGMVGFERAHLVLEGMGLLHLKTGQSPTTDKWAQDIADKIGSENERRAQVQAEMSDQERRREELRRFSAAASMPSERDMLPGPVFRGRGLAAEIAEQSTLPVRRQDRRGNAVRVAAREYLREQMRTAGLSEHGRGILERLLVKEQAGDVKWQEFPSTLVDTISRFGNLDRSPNFRDSRYLLEVANHLDRIIYGRMGTRTSFAPQRAPIDRRYG